MSTKTAKHSDNCEAGLARVGECRGCAEESLDRLFDAIPKSKRAELFGELNELSLFVARIGKTRVVKKQAGA